MLRAQELRKIARKGGLARNRKLSREIKLDRARLAGQWRHARKYCKLTRSQLLERVKDRIAERNPLLAEWVWTAMRTPTPIGREMFNLMKPRAQAYAVSVLEDVVREAVGE